MNHKKQCKALAFLEVGRKTPPQGRLRAGDTLTGKVDMDTLLIMLKFVNRIDCKIISAEFLASYDHSARLTTKALTSEMSI
jgi:hypothetical protein